MTKLVCTRLKIPVTTQADIDALVSFSKRFELAFSMTTQVGWLGRTRFVELKADSKTGYSALERLSRQLGIS